MYNILDKKQCNILDLDRIIQCSAKCDKDNWITENEQCIFHFMEVQRLQMQIRKVRVFFGACGAVGVFPEIKRLRGVT